MKVNHVKNVELQENIEAEEIVLIVEKIFNILKINYNVLNQEVNSVE